VSKFNDLAALFAKQMPTWPEGRLPTVRELAAHHGASTRTVALALDLLRRQGLVESRRGSGQWRAGQVPVARPAGLKPNAQDFTDQLCDEIRQGLHPWNTDLPSMKVLASRWNCHPQTASKALDAAVRAGVLERHGRRHRPVRPRPARKVSPATLLCIGATDAEGRFRMDTDRESDFWRELSSQAAQAGLSLLRRPWTRERIRPDPSSVGVVASTWHFQEPGALCRELERLRLPVCVWTEEYTLKETSSRSSRLRFHEQGYQKEVGIQAAGHLLDLGHVRFAYISPWHASRWSRSRHQGVVEEVESRGGVVEAFCLDGISVWDRLAPAYSDPKLHAHFPAAVLARLVEGSSDPIREDAIRELGMNRIRRDTSPLLEKALASRATAWIAANDVCALHALAWLGERGVQVPGQISVSGFDDTVEALRADLTSYRFASDAMARAMLRQLLSSSPAPAMMRHNGIVVARGSSAPPA